MLQQPWHVGLLLASYGISEALKQHFSWKYCASHKTLVQQEPKKDGEKLQWGLLKKAVAEGLSIGGNINTINLCL